jgi:hypothetical protein
LSEAASALVVLQLITSSFDLATLQARNGCDRSRIDEITVCGRRDSADRFRIGSTAPGEKELLLPRLETRFGNVVADLSVKQRTLDNGAASRPIMVTIKVPF